jgi:hypothetical protein
VDLRNAHRQLNVQISVPFGGPLVEHDRTILIQLFQGGTDRFYRLLLGQGLFGFEANCRRRSEGVWFEISGNEFNAAWDSF